MVQKIDHIGYCVNSIDETISFYRTFTKVEEIGRKAFPERNQVSCTIRIGEGENFIELMEPIGTEGVVAAFLQKRGQGLHHISLFTDDLEGTCRQMEEAGVKIVGKTKSIAFTHPKTSKGVVYEITNGTFDE